ncbi:MAG: NAD(P)-binding domain-containing protein [Verrucomicrobiota bacterium]
MKIAIIGTGMVGNAIGTKLVQLGHDVKMGSRTATNEKAAAWVKAAGTRASQGTFADAAAFAELVFNCAAGTASLSALEAAGATNLEGKIIVDVANPLDFSNGMPPTLTICNTDSLGERIQGAFPGAKVVKTLNTMTCNLMVNPALLAGEHDVFVSGNDAGAKGKVVEILKAWFGWKNVIDLGDITTARGTEMLLPFWIRTMGALQTPMFNFHVVR